MVCKASRDKEEGGKAPVEILEREKSIFCFQFSVQVTQNLTHFKAMEKKIHKCHAHCDF